MNIVMKTVLKTFAKKFLNAARESTGHLVFSVKSEIANNGLMSVFFYSETGNLIPQKKEKKIEISEEDMNRFCDLFRLNGYPDFEFADSIIMILIFSEKYVTLQLLDEMSESGEDIFFSNTINF